MNFDNCIKQIEEAADDAQEAEKAVILLSVLYPALRWKKNGRVDTLNGDKTPLGLYRTIKRTMLL